jgi:hypothetical protein
MLDLSYAFLNALGSTLKLKACTCQAHPTFKDFRNLQNPTDSAKIFSHDFGILCHLKVSKKSAIASPKNGHPGHHEAAELGKTLLSTTITTMVRIRPGDWALKTYGYGSIPMNTIFRGMNIHFPAILMFTRGTRF